MMPPGFILWYSADPRTRAHGNKLWQILRINMCTVNVVSCNKIWDKSNKSWAMYTFFLAGNKSTFPLWRNNPSNNLLLDSKFICTYVNKHVPTHTHVDEKHKQIYIEPSDNIVDFIFSTLQKSLPPAYGKYFKSQIYVHKRLSFPLTDYFHFKNYVFLMGFTEALSGYNHGGL